MTKQLQILKIILGLVFLIHSESAWSCSCMETSNIKTSIKEADYIVTGKILDSQVVQIWSDTSYAKSQYEAAQKKDALTNYEVWKNNNINFNIQLIDYTLLIETVYKGKVKSDTITIRTGFGNGDCGFEFKIGASYLIYGKYEKNINYSSEKLGRSQKELQGIFRTNICYRTQLLTSAQSDLEYLGQ